MSSLARVGSAGLSWFGVFKCFVYGSLCWSSSQFIYEDLVAAGLILNQGSSAADYLNIFSVTIDTVSWLILLVIFELETSVLDDARLHGRLRWLLSGISAICYLVIIYAFLGYVGKLLMLGAATAFDGSGLCERAGESLAVMIDMDEYQPLGPANCAALEQAGALGKIEGQPIIFQQSLHAKVLGLAAAAAINSGAWILVVAILQLDIVMQLRGGLSRGLLVTSTICKGLLYLVLALVAIYWGVVGDFVDFWDAFLWLAGFFVIELNVFRWAGAGFGAGGLEAVVPDKALQ